MWRDSCGSASMKFEVALRSLMLCTAALKYVEDRIHLHFPSWLIRDLITAFTLCSALVQADVYSLH